MKKGISKVLVLILAAGILLLPACGKTDTSGDNDQSVQNADNNAPNARNNPPGGFMGGNADLYGEVKAINGSKLTISVLEMPQIKQMTDEDRQKMRERRPGGSGNADNAPNPGNAPDSGNAPKPNASGRPDRGGFMGGEKKYTGETVELDVASDTPITSFGMGGNMRNRSKDTNGGSGNGNNNSNNNDNNNSNDGNGNGGNRGFGNFEEKQLSLSDIKVGSVIQVWYKDNTDKKEIKNIRVTQAFDAPKEQQNSSNSK